MAFLGSAALLLAFDIVPDAIVEHDDWHTHEHLPERLAIPGFLRGSRWVAVQGAPRYVVVYEVAELASLTSAAYLDRLDHPTAWTSKMMAHYRGMTRGLCAVAGGWGAGMGSVMYVIRFDAAFDAFPALRARLLDEVGPGLPAKRGLGSVHVLEGTVNAPMTNEQRIRGRDATVAAALLIGGYEAQAVSESAHAILGSAEGPGVAAHGLYRLDYAVSHDDLGR
jgi:hypothetical protein